MRRFVTFLALFLFTLPFGIAINGCGKCVDSHEKVVREKGVSEETVLAIVRVASVMHAIGSVLDTERVAKLEPVAV